MSKFDTRKTVLEIINEVRRLQGYSSVESLDADKHSLVLLHLLNVVMDKMSDYGDWHEMLRTGTVTAVSSTARYSIPSTEPVKRVYEISFHTDKQSLYPISLENYNQYTRGGSFGRPRFFTVKGVDVAGNPFFQVNPTPAAAEAGRTFSVEYYVSQRLFDVSSADDEVPFPAKTVIQGVYAAALEEEGGGNVSKQSLGAQADFMMMMDENLKRFTSDTGTDIWLQPKHRGR